MREKEQLCEQAREERLKPMRDAEIARCKSEGKDPGYCERYWNTLGRCRPPAERDHETTHVR